MQHKCGRCDDGGVFRSNVDSRTSVLDEIHVSIYYGFYIEYLAKGTFLLLHKNRAIQDNLSKNYMIDSTDSMCLSTCTHPHTHLTAIYSKEINSL